METTVFGTTRLPLTGEGNSLTCNQPGCTKPGPYKSKQGLAVHMARGHGIGKDGQKVKRWASTAGKKLKRRGKLEVMVRAETVQITQAEFAEYQELKKIKSILGTYPYCPGCKAPVAKFVMIAGMAMESEQQKA